jgi:uncharacterized membrane protein
MRRVRLSQGLLAIALASVAILSLNYRDFIPLGQSFPAWIPWREGWIYGSALLLLLVSTGLCFARTALPSALVACAYLALWALICALPVFSEPRGIGAWYGFCEALAPLVGAWIVYASLRPQAQGSVRVAQALFGLTCVFYGWSHFAYADYTASMVPTWLPGHLGLAYFTGFCHVAAGIGMVICVFPRLAATLEATMMTLFGLLVWVPSFFTQPRPAWATPAENAWSELVVNVVLAMAAWIVAISLRSRSWSFNSQKNRH